MGFQYTRGENNESVVLGWKHKRILALIIFIKFAFSTICMVKKDPSPINYCHAIYSQQSAQGYYEITSQH